MTSRAREPSIGKKLTRVAVLGGALMFVVAGLLLGPRVYLDRGGRPWVEILPTTFEVWETQHPADHLFLAFSSPDDATAGRAYAHYSQPLLILEYLCLQPFRWVGMSYSRAQIGLCLPQLVLLILLLMAQLQEVHPFAVLPLRANEVLRLGVLILAAAGVLTLPPFWVPFFRFNPEQYFFLPALAFCYLAGADYRGQMRRRDAILTLVPIALLAPVFTPFLVLSWFVLGWGGRVQGKPGNWGVVAWLGAIALLGAVVFEMPRLVGAAGGVTVIGSDFRFRSGLDGSEHYFTSMAQALWAPSYPPGRAWQLWHWPIAALAAIGGVAMLSRAVAVKMVRQLFICWVPLLWMVIAFPQLVSVHPYYFDFHITVGAAVCVLFWLQLPELDRWSEMPALRLAILMAVSALLMTNLIDLARLGIAPAE